MPSPRAGHLPRPLNIRQRRFIEEYLRTGNGTQSAIQAGYYVRHASNTASDLLKRGDVRAAIEAGRAAPTPVPEEQTDPALRELEAIAYANILDFTRPAWNGALEVDWKRITRAQAAAIKELVIEDVRNTNGNRRVIRIRMADKQAALSRLLALSPARKA